MISSERTRPKSVKLVLYGPPDIGKTVACCELSEHWNGYEIQKDTVELEDILAIPWDGDEAYAGVEVLNYTVPKIQDVIFETDIRKIMKSSIKEIEAHVLERKAAGKHTTVIDDTVTTRCSRLVASLEEKGIEGWELWGQVLVANRRWFEALHALPCDVVSLLHSTYLFNDDQKKKGKETGTGTGSKVIPDIPGKTRQMYMNQKANVFPMLADKTNGGARTIFTVPGTTGALGYEIKNKYRMILDAKEPSLRGIFDKLKGR